MTLARVRGQAGALRLLDHALACGKAHHAYRFEGPEGVGKELCAFAFAQALVCERGGGCESCDACRRAVTLSAAAPHVPLHPDVILIEKGLYAETFRDDRGKRLEEKNEISIQQIRQVVLPQVGFAPAEGRARVFIIRRAEELSTGAANALLKTLEEPGRGTHFILLTSRPDKMLPTIRSRTLPVRFGRLPRELLRDILREQGVPAQRLDELCELGEGSVAQALALADADAEGRRSSFIISLLEALRSVSAGSAAAFGEGAGADRASTRADLLGFATHLCREAKRLAHGSPAAAAHVAHAHALTLKLASDIELSNASPVLGLSALLLELSRLPGLAAVRAPKVTNPQQHEAP